MPDTPVPHPSAAAPATFDVAIVGLGYVGLPLSLQFARSGGTVLGLDIDPAKVEALNAGRSYIKHIDGAAVQMEVAAGRFAASVDFSRVREARAVIICVPTPLNKNREPDISYVLDTGRVMAPHLTKGTVVVLESTTYPGTTDTDLLQVLEAGSGLKAGVDFHLAFSPEREDPGNPDSKVGEVPIQPNGDFDFCYLRPRRLHNVRERCHTVFAYRVKQKIGPFWITVYDGVAGQDYFGAGEEAHLRTSHPLARPCGDGPTPPDEGDGTGSVWRRLALPWFILAFLAVVAVNSLVTIPPMVVTNGLIASKALLLLAVTATAMRSRMDLLLEMGWRATIPVATATIASFTCALGFAVLLL